MTITIKKIKAVPNKTSNSHTSYAIARRGCGDIDFNAGEHCKIAKS
jgi:hypothetical protein